MRWGLAAAVLLVGCAAPDDPSVAGMVVASEIACPGCARHPATLAVDLAGALAIVPAMARVR